MSGADEDDWYPDDDLPDDEDDLYDECGMRPDGQCSMAGSEWCDWSCPVQRMHARERIAAIKRKSRP